MGRGGGPHHPRLHPLGQRLDSWRLKNFDGTRLPAAAGTYPLPRGGDPENPSDERLIALAEVRDVTTQLNEGRRGSRGPGHWSAPRRGSLTAFAARSPAGRSGSTTPRRLFVWRCSTSPQIAPAMAKRITADCVNAGLEESTILASIKDDQASQPSRVAIRFSYSAGAGIVANVTAPEGAVERPRSSTHRRCSVHRLAAPSTPTS